MAYQALYTVLCGLSCSARRLARVCKSFLILIAFPKSEDNVIMGVIF